MALTGVPMPIRDFEGAVELTYQIQLGDNWSVQPDLQYVIHPGGHIPDPLVALAARPIADAFVIGMRTMLKF